MSNTLVSPQLDREQYGVELSKYQDTKVIALSGQSFELQPNNTIPIVIDVPPIVHNVSRTKYRAKITYTTDVADNRYLMVYRNTLPFSQYTCTTRNSAADLVTLNSHCREYVEVKSLADISQAELASNSEVNMSKECETDYLRNPKSIGRLGTIGLQEPQYFRIFDLSGNASVEFEIQGYLSDIKGFITELDKSIYFGDVLTHSFTLTHDIGFTTGSDTMDLGATFGALQGNVTISEFALYVAEEKNPRAVEALMKLANTESGIKFIVPHSHVVQHDFNNSDNNSVIVRVGRSNGQTLTAIKNTVWEASKDVGEAFLRLDSFVKSYRTKLNTQDLHREERVVAKHDTYMDMKERLSGTPLQKESVFNANFMVEDRFDNGEHMGESQVLSGLALANGEIMYQFDAVMNNNTQNNKNYRHLTIVECQKILVINKDGITFQ